MYILKPKEGQNCTFITNVSLKVQRRAGNKRLQSEEKEMETEWED